MKKGFKLLALLLILALVFPITKIFALDSGDSTIFVRIPEGNGCILIDSEGEQDYTCETRRYFVTGGSSVTLIALPDEGYHLVGWYEFTEEDDGNGNMSYPLSDEPLAIGTELSYLTEENGFLNIAPVFAEGEAIPEIEFEGDLELESLEAGPLPDISISSLTENVSVVSASWAELDNDTREWKDHVGDAEAGKFYAAKLTLEIADGFVVKPDAVVYYNSRDMYDTYSTVEVDGTTVNVYIDFAEAKGDQEPPAQAEVITRVDFEVDMPKVGDEVDENTQYGVRINDEDVSLYGPDGDDEHNFMYIYDPENDNIFEGTLEAGYNYQLIFWFVSFENYVFEDDVEIYVNGEPASDYYLESENRLGIAYDFTLEEEEDTVTYNLSTEDGKYMVEFEYADGEDFEFVMVDILSYTPEEIEEMFDVPAEVVAEMLEEIKQITAEYGDLLGLYDIEIFSQNVEITDEGLTLRIKMTEEMEQYNTFKFLYLDDNNEFAVQEIHDPKYETIDGVRYLVFDLDHLSTYALVGSTVQNNESGNPGTGDHLIFNVSMLVLSVLGLAGAAIYTKKKRYF